MEKEELKVNCCLKGMANEDGLNGAGSCSLIEHDPHLFTISRLIVIQDKGKRKVIEFQEFVGLVCTRKNKELLQWIQRG